VTAQKKILSAMAAAAAFVLIVNALPRRTRLAMLPRPKIARGVIRKLPENARN
jgi:hypothetical protein